MTSLVLSVFSFLTSILLSPVDLVHVGVKRILVLSFSFSAPDPTSLPSLFFCLPLLAPDKFRMGVSSCDGVCTLWGLIFSLRPLLFSWMLGVWVLFLSGGHYDLFIWLFCLIIPFFC